MDFQTRMRRIHDFLKPYQNIWQNEIMLLYPNCFDHFPSDWLDEISQIDNTSDLLALEKKYYKGLLKNKELIDFYQEIENLTQFPRPPSFPPFSEDKYTWIKITPKKKHEIQKLAPLINEYYKSQNVERIIDIGGGIGLLSQTLAKSYQHKIISLDMDQVLQSTGEARFKKYGGGQTTLEFKHVRVSGEEAKFLVELQPQRMTVGLHTCGSLAVDQIRASAENNLKAIISLGCCYLKLSEDGSDQNISLFSQSFSSPLVMNPFALTLACGAHRKVSHKSISFKRQVKFYRYTLHTLLADHYQHSELIIF
ncbi:MAG: methyltransferase, partial [Bacteriovoracaceae bacterium]